MNKVFVLQLLSELKQAQNGVTTAKSSAANRMIESINIVVLSLHDRERHQAPLSTIIGRKRQRAALWGNSTGSGVDDGVRSGI